MDDVRRYFAEEIAVDHADGLLTRREALRRLGALGFGVAAASTVLAACGGDDDDDETPATAPASSTTVVSARPNEPVTFPGDSGQLQGAWAAAPSPKGAVLVIHENRGLTDHIRSVASRLAGSGYSALALDLLSAEGGTRAVGDEAAAMAALANAPKERFVTDMQSAVTELQRRAPNVKLGVVGFCFGGGQVWSLLASGEPRLAAAVPFYGPAPADPDFSKSKAAVLGVYAEKDARVNATRDAAEAALTRAGLPHEMRTFPGVDHAFFNDTGPRYDAAQAAAAYTALQDWFARYLK